MTEMATMSESRVTGRAIIASAPEMGTEGCFHAVNPRDGGILDTAFGMVSPAQLRRATGAAHEAFDVFRDSPPALRAGFLARIADNIDAIGGRLTERGVAETGLSAQRLESERVRTVGQLRLFAEVVRKGDHLEARIDPRRSDSDATPGSDIRQRHIPLGPVAVFGASNFPLAFSSAGGDTASALAAGCPVIVKAHNAHPGTAELVGQAIAAAVRESGLPGGVFSLLFGSGRTIGQDLVADQSIKAVGFTGSRSGGMALVRIASERAEPIPVYAEMSSTNPVIVLPSVLDGASSELAREFVASLTMGSGQFCTNPGLVFVPAGKRGDELVTEIADALGSTVGQTMLTDGIARAFDDGVGRREGITGVTVAARGRTGSGPNAPAPVLFTTALETFLADPSLQDEIFGSAALVVRYPDAAQLIAVMERLHGQLTAAIFAGPADFADVSRILPVLERRVGRIIYNEWPTGVQVNHAMVHGGPFPATSDSRTTSVGTLAIRRFQRPVSYQNLPDELLPPALQEANPLGLLRRIDGVVLGMSPRPGVPL